MTKKLAIVLASVLGGLIIVSTIVIAVVVSNQRAATQEADYHACIIAAAEHVDPSDYGADTAHEVAAKCRTIVYGN
ncbi:hypothetical protein ACTJJ4_03005 [Microbacterium sp. 22195]|uniref:hypothetical protein n=1 Tax=Microbacterium sp. 22195 TaxID=3453891 RepID=UPI003F85ADB6